jgi:hypothetical protein
MAAKAIGYRGVAGDVHLGDGDAGGVALKLGLLGGVAPAVSRIVPQTRSPRSAKARTAAAPKPLLAPVMTMVLAVSGMGHSPACAMRYRLVQISEHSVKT